MQPSASCRRIASRSIPQALAFRGVAVSLYAEQAIDRWLAAALRKNEVEAYADTPVLSLERGPVVCTEGTKAPYDQVLLSTGATAPPWLLSSGLPIDARGFLLVERTLQCLSQGDLFAVGDCATLRDGPHPKSGVYSVRHAEVLSANLAAAAQGKSSMRRYTAQRRALMLISCGGRRAIGRWGSLQAEGAWLWRVKDAIDRRWIERFK